MNVPSDLESETSNPRISPHGKKQPSPKPVSFSRPLIFSKWELTSHQMVMLGVMAVYTFYLGYRILYTLNPDVMGFSLLFLYAEAHGLLALGLYFFQLWNPTIRVPPSPFPGYTVDVLIPTYNEDLSLLRKTAISCLGMTYPGQVYFLDDGARPELKAMAEELGCKYISRTHRTQAKAGNLNHALSVTEGEFIAVFDADYVPHPTFLERTLGYFQDPGVAFVQTPHNYYNVDSFQFWINEKKRDKWNEQDAFYRLIMPGRDHWNAAFFAGTSAVIRREALESIGGFAADTITEDVETSIRLYAKGWRGIYHNEVLSNGLAATDLASYHQQKLRWAEGNINLLFSENPLTKKGLTIPQRLCFFATVFGWFVGIPETIYFITPPIMLLTGWYPIEPFDWTFLMVYLVFIGVLLGGFKYVSRGYGRVRMNNVYNMTNFFVLIKAVFKSFLRWNTRFVVTRKGPGEGLLFKTIFPQVFIALLCAAGMVWGVLHLVYGMTQDYLIYSIGIFWAAVNGVVALAVIRKVTEPLLDRKHFRFIGTVPVQFDNGQGTHFGVSKDLNETGLSLETFAPLDPAEPLFLKLHLGSHIVKAPGMVVYEAPAREAVISHHTLRTYGIEFGGLTQDEKDVIQQYCFHLVLPTYFHHFAQRDSIVRKVCHWFGMWRRYHRRAFRQRMTLPCQVSGPFSFLTVVNDISQTGVAFLSHQPLEIGQEMVIGIFGAEAAVKMGIAIRNCQKIAPGYVYVIGAEFIEPVEGTEHPLLPYMSDQGGGAAA